ELEEFLLAGDVERADEVLCTYYDSVLDDVRETIIAAFPQRAKVLVKAFEAHTRGDYELSVPVLLVQADGIAQESIRIGLYQKKNGEPATRSYVDNLSADGFMSGFLEPLRLALPLTAPTASRGGAPVGLNRHQVLHGESVEYGTKKFSLQAISLVAYVVWVLGEREDH
ncbi:MAG: hypothetical protein V3V67_06050, partial [Myxococcota bacterium]